MLEPLDAYNLGRFLRDRGGAVESIEDVYDRYTHPVMLSEKFPIFMLNTHGPDSACVFLENSRCAVYEARPRVCRLYPFSVGDGKRGRHFEFYQCFDRHSGHFSGGRVNVGDWMYQNFPRETRTFVEADFAFIAEWGKLLRRLDPREKEAELFPLLYYRYFNYDLDRPFLEQYTPNCKALLNQIRDRLNSKEDKRI